MTNFLIIHKLILIINKIFLIIHKIIQIINHLFLIMQKIILIFHTIIQNYPQDNPIYLQVKPTYKKEKISPKQKINNDINIVIIEDNISLKQTINNDINNVIIEDNVSPK